MLSKKDQLIELIRKLEEQDHIFSVDPKPVTERLKTEQGKFLDKLYKRASRIDSNHQLQNILEKITVRTNVAISLLSIVWCITGFLGLFTLLNANIVNFFYVLICILGMHTLMFLISVLTTLLSNNDKPSIFSLLVSPSHLVKKKDPITKAATALYEDQLKHSGMRWYIGKISHQLWLATLIGMLISLVLLFAVKDFSFTWESTLLSSDTIASIVNIMSWLPNMVGFATPTAEQVLQSQQFASLANQDLAQSHNFNWAMLLIGSLVMYGIVPRFLFWIFCTLMFKQSKMSLDLNLPYYQKIYAYWQRDITDKDDFAEKIQPTPKKAEVFAGAKLVATFEFNVKDDAWYQTIVTDNYQIFGTIDSRDDMDKILAYLAKHDVQVILAVNSNTLPDRGTLRKLSKLSKHANHGLIIKLVNLDNDDEQATLRHQQWIEALAERNIALMAT